MNAYDESHADELGFKKSVDECKNILTYLWSTAKGLIPATIFVTGSDDSETSRWMSQRHNNCISSSSTTSNNSNNGGMNEEIIQSLTHSIDNQTILFESLRQDKQDEKEEKTNKYGDLHDSTKLLILNASSVEGDLVPTEPVLSCKDFFNKKNISKALDFLDTSLSQDLGCCVSIDTGLVTALYSGHFLRDREDSPSNFSFFMIPKKLPLSANKSKPTMILQLKASQGKGWSETDLKDALKQGIVTPADIHSFGHQMKNFWGLSTFFFGKDSLLSQALEPLLHDISVHTLTFEAAQLRDKLFATKLGYAIDTRVFRWLQLCRNSKDRNQVNDSLLNFSFLFNQVLTDSFLQLLPTTFKKFSSTQETDESDSDMDSAKPKSKRRKQIDRSEKSLKERVVNDKTIKTWIVSPKEYGTCFAARNLGDRPMLKGKPMCQRYHSKGYCFHDCLNKATHIPSKEIEDTIKVAYSKYVEKCKLVK